MHLTSKWWRAQQHLKLQHKQLKFSTLSIIIPRFPTMKEQGISSNQSTTLRMCLPCDHSDIISKSVHHSIGALKISTEVSFTAPLARCSPCICSITRWYQFAFVFWLHLTVCTAQWMKADTEVKWGSSAVDFDKDVISSCALMSRALKKNRRA